MAMIHTITPYPPSIPKPLAVGDTVRLVDGADVTVLAVTSVPIVVPPPPPPPPPPVPQPTDDMGRVLALVPTAQATRTVNGVMRLSALGPVDGDKVHVPAGATLMLDGVSASLKWLRVDGALVIDPNANIKLFVDTLVSSEGSEVTFDNSTGTGTFQCVFTGGPMDPVADPFLFGRGFIPMGAFTAKGRYVEPVAWTGGTTKGDTAFTLANGVPMGWDTGDKLVFPGVGPMTLDDDEVSVTGFSGNTIVFSPALKFDHPKTEKRPAPAYNISPRSIDFSSESTILAERGHVMVMSHPKDTHAHATAEHTVGHVSGGVGISDVSFRGLGRTNKAVALTDPNGTVGATQANPRGRYSLHFHKCGVSPSSPAIMVDRVVVVDSPGWGVVNHSSHVCVDNSIGYKVFGSTFVAEAGDENGCFCDCHSIRNSAPIGHKDVSDVQGERGVSDWLNGGHGFATMCGPIRFEGTNYVWGSPHSAVHLQGKALVVGGKSVLVYRANLPDPSITAKVSFDPKHVPQNISNLRIYGSYCGVLPWELNSNLVSEPLIGKSTFSNIYSETAQDAVGLGYLSNLTFEDCEFQSLRPWTSTGIGHSGFNTSMIYRRLKFGRFAVAIQGPTTGVNELREWSHECLTGLTLWNAVRGTRRLDIDPPTRVQIPATALASITTASKYFDFQNRKQADVYMRCDAGGSSLYAGLKNNWLYYTLGTWGIFADDVIRYGVSYLYFPEQGRDFALSKIPTMLPDLKTLTGEQLYDQKGVCFGAKLAPVGAVHGDALGVFGLLSMMQPMTLPQLEVTKTTLGNNADTFQSTATATGYMVKVKNKAGVFATFGPFELTPNAFTFCMIDIDGSRRGVPVWCEPGKVFPANW